MSYDDHGGPGGVFARFVHSEVTGSIVLLTCTLVALALANSPWAGVYDDLLHTYIGVSFTARTWIVTIAVESCPVPAVSLIT